MKLWTQALLQLNAAAAADDDDDTAAADIMI